MTKKRMNFSGSFYPNDKNELLKYFDFFTSKQTNKNININPRAIIVPHAGYVYSGIVANLAYTLSKNSQPKRVIVIGPSHRHYLNGASIGLFDFYECLLGDLKIDKKFALELIAKYPWLNFDEDAHLEHSTETQIPFIKNYFDTKVLEIVYGKIEFTDLSKLISELLKDEENFLVISTDLSHFYNLKEANILDEICINAIRNQDLEKLDEGCEACGMVGVKALLNSSKELGLEVEFLDYKTSFETTNDSSSVVGYASFLLGDSIGI